MDHVASSLILLFWDQRQSFEKNRRKEKLENNAISEERSTGKDEVQQALGLLAPRLKGI